MVAAVLSPSHPIPWGSNRARHDAHTATSKDSGTAALTREQVAGISEKAPNPRSPIAGRSDAKG